MQASMERLASLLSRLPLGTLRTTVRKWAHNLRGTSSAAPAADARLAVQRASNALKQLLQREGLAPGSDSARMRHPAIVVGFVQVGSIQGADLMTQEAEVARTAALADSVHGQRTSNGLPHERLDLTERHSGAARTCCPGCRASGTRLPVVC